MKRPAKPAKSRRGKTKTSAKKTASRVESNAGDRARAGEQDCDRAGDDDSRTLPASDLLLGESVECELPANDDPPKPLRHRKIHKRRKVPRIRKGKAVDDPKPTPEAKIKRRGKDEE